MTALHAYTADMNHVYTLPSGNWFTGFVANTKTRTVSFNYCDRRRAGQVARRYILRFEEDCSTVKDIVAISAQGGRVEMFKSTVVRETAANILRRGMMVEFEQKLEEECEPKVEAKEVEQVEPAKEEQEHTPFFYGLFLFLVTVMVTVGIVCIASPKGSEVFEICRDVFYFCGLGSFLSAFFCMHELNS